MFGGYRRGRISSQCLKRSIRHSPVFEEAFGDGLLAHRTKLLPQLLDEALQQLGVEDDVRETVVMRAPEIGTEAGRSGSGEVGEDEAGPGETKQLIFLTHEEVNRLARELAELCRRKGAKNFASKKTKIAEITREVGSGVPRSVDIAMFGRMTTSTAFDDIAAAVQVAHALTTNRVDSEFDYYTAVDDLSGEAGAGMIGDVEFNSATYYKFFSVHWEGLLKNLAGDVEVARRAVRALIEAAATANPSGKQNSFAAHNPPDMVLVELRDRNIPLNYSNAFVAPCYPQRRSLMQASVEALADYLGRIDAMYELGGARLHADTGPYELPGSERMGSLPALLDAVEARLS